jgi:hypothetical protein
VQVLRDGTAKAKQYSARAMCNLAYKSEYKETIAAAGAIALLVLLLSDGTEGAKTAAAPTLSKDDQCCSGCHPSAGAAAEGRHGGCERVRCYGATEHSSR